MFGSSYWKGLLTWIEDTLLADERISPEDLTLFEVVDEVDEAVAVIREFYENNRCDWPRR